MYKSKSLACMWYYFVKGAQYPPTTILITMHCVTSDPIRRTHST